MATFRVDGMDGLEEMLGNVAALPDDLINRMLHAEAKVVVKAQKETAKAMLQGPYYKGAVSDSVAQGKIKSSKSGKEIKIIFKGTQHGESLARIAYLNEYGTKKIPARPFVKTANEKSADEAVDAAAEIFDKWVEAQ